MCCPSSRIIQPAPERPSRQKVCLSVHASVNSMMEVCVTSGTASYICESKQHKTKNENWGRIDVQARHQEKRKSTPSLSEERSFGGRFVFYGSNDAQSVETQNDPRKHTIHYASPRDSVDVRTRRSRICITWVAHALGRRMLRHSVFLHGRWDGWRNGICHTRCESLTLLRRTRWHGWRTIER